MIESASERSVFSRLFPSLSGAVAVLLALAVASAAAAQDRPPPRGDIAASGTAAGAASGNSAEGRLPRSFRGLSLGMDAESLKSALASDGMFAFRGDRDVSLLPRGEETLIETTGLSFIRRAFFQFKDGALFMMAFTLDPDKVDHYSVFTAFVADYGDPASLDPSQAVWLSGDTRVSIERPLTVKYIDRGVFDSLAKDAGAKESKEAILRKEFLGEF